MKSISGLAVTYMGESQMARPSIKYIDWDREKAVQYPNSIGYPTYDKWADHGKAFEKYKIDPL